MESRVNKSLRNTLVGISGLLINLLVLFFTKSIFIRLLGAEYNGVNGLFGNILDLLNLAELGFASAIAFFLYRPLTEGDEETAAKLMNFFSKVYRVIALIVAVAGSICIPFLQDAKVRRRKHSGQSPNIAMPPGHVRGSCLFQGQPRTYLLPGMKERSLETTAQTVNVRRAVTRI